MFGHFVKKSSVRLSGLLSRLVSAQVESGKEHQIERNINSVCHHIESFVATLECDKVDRVHAK